MARIPARMSIALLLLALALPATAQTSPFLPDELYRKLANEISGDIAYDHLRTLTQFDVPNGGANDFMRQAEWIQAKAREYGLEDIRVIELPYSGTGWSPLGGELWLIEPAPDGATRRSKLGSYAQVATSIAQYSRPADVAAELVDVGHGTRDRDYAGIDVKGKIVLAAGPPRDVEREAVWKRGALGIVSYFSSRANPMDYPDQIAWTSVNPRANAEGQEPRFAFVVSPRTGLALRDRLLGSPRPTPFAAPGEQDQTQPERLRVHVKIESQLHPGITQKIVEAWVRGRARGPHVVLTAHVQEEKTSANDDRSGVANVLEIGRALMRLIGEGALPRPERDIRLWWVNEIAAPYMYFAVHPEERQNVLVNINQDMVGAHQTVGGISRVQHVTRTPWSRPTFFNDVVESVVTALYHGNNSYIAARQSGQNQPGVLYSRPLFSRLGTRDRYSLEIVPYFGNTDHLVFNDGYVAATHGGVTFTNYPDEYIHSSDDDIWQMDPTVFQRNAVAVAGLAWFMATAGPRDVPAVNALLVPGALARIQRDVRAASAARLERRANAWDSENMLEQALRREAAAAASVRTIAAEDKAALSSVEAAVKAIQSSREALRAGVTAAAAIPSPPYPAPVGTERIPVKAVGLREWREKVNQIAPVQGFHSLMRFEAANLADGERTLWDIYSILRAQSLAAGEWYYGTVTPEMVVQYFDNAAKLGLVSFKETPRVKDVMKKPAKR